MHTIYICIITCQASELISASNMPTELMAAPTSMGGYYS